MPHDPNAPLEAYQRKLDREEKFMQDLGETSSVHDSGGMASVPVSTIHRGPLPTMDQQEAPDEFSDFEKFN